MIVCLHIAEPLIGITVSFEETKPSYDESRYIIPKYAGKSTSFQTSAVAGNHPGQFIIVWSVMPRYVFAWIA